ncbi:MAG TPA: hypothetical protein VF608_04475, partial [Thermoanaerobaculia bacterium]
TGTPAPASLLAQRRGVVIAKTATVLALISAAVVLPDLLGVLVVAIVIVGVLPLPGRAERKCREAKRRDAENAWINAYRAAEDALSVGPLQRKRQQLQGVKTAFESVEPERQKELANLAQHARDIQLHHYLEQQLIRAHKIPDIGPQRKATLAAWGIETAADVTWQAIAGVQGFGPTLQSRLVAWRVLIESHFVFDAKRAVPQPDIDAVECRWRRRRSDLEQQLRAGAEESRRMNSYLRQRRLAIARDLEAPARAWAQAMADVEVFDRAMKMRRSTP